MIAFELPGNIYLAECFKYKHVLTNTPSFILTEQFIKEEYIIWSLIYYDTANTVRHKLITQAYSSFMKNKENVI